MTEQDEQLAIKVAKLEEVLRQHEKLHALEDKALQLAQDVTKAKFLTLNDVERRFVDKTWFEKIHSLLENRVTLLEQEANVGTGEKGILEKFWPLLLAILTFVAGHFWK